MEEKELIAKLKGLKEIKPNHNWVVSVKAEILGKPFDAAQGKPKAALRQNACQTKKFLPSLRS